MTRTERIALAAMLCTLWLRMALAQPLSGLEGSIVAFLFSMAVILFVFGWRWSK